VTWRPLAAFAVGVVMLDASAAREVAIIIARNTSGCHAEAPKLVGIHYEAWFPRQAWDNVWDLPLEGIYSSNDTTVVTRHARQIAEAGVDFLRIDWTNNIVPMNPCDPGTPRVDLCEIEQATTAMFDVFRALAVRPNISIYLGISDASGVDLLSHIPDDLTAKANRVYDLYIQNPAYRAVYQYYLGKPLLPIFLGTPTACWTGGGFDARCSSGVPNWNDSRFTVRWVTGYVSSQPWLLDGLLSKYGYWSDLEREPLSYTMLDGKTEQMAVDAHYPAPSPPVCPQGWAGRRSNGATFDREWNAVYARNPRIVVVNGFNTWVRAEQVDPDCSFDIEPSVVLGDRYIQLLKGYVSRYKAP